MDNILYSSSQTITFKLSDFLCLIFLRLLRLLCDLADFFDLPDLAVLVLPLVLRLPDFDFLERGDHSGLHGFHDFDVPEDLRLLEFWLLRLESTDFRGLL